MIRFVNKLSGWWTTDVSRSVILTRKLVGDFIRKLILADHGFCQRTAGGGRAGAVTILGTEQERPTACRPLTEAEPAGVPSM